MGIKAHAFLRIGIISPGNFRPLLQFCGVRPWRGPEGGLLSRNPSPGGA